MSDLLARFRVELEGDKQFERFFEKGISGTRNLETAWGRAMSTMSQGINRTVSDLGKYSVAAGKAVLSATGINIGIQAQAKGILEFRDNVARLGTAANISEGQISGLRNQILDVSVATGQMKEGVQDALGAFVAKTGDIETARLNLELYARTATATGAALSDISLIGSELSSKMGIKDQRSALGILAKQGDVGAIEFKDLGTQGPRLFAAAASAGFKGEEGVRKIGGLAQLFAEGVGGSGAAARVSTSVEGLMRDVSRRKGQFILQEEGIKVNNRDAIEITKDFIRKFKGNDRAMAATGMFTAATFRGVQTMSRDFREHGGKFTELDKFTNAGGGDSIIDEKFARNAKTGAFANRKSQAEIDRAADKLAGDTVENLSRGLGKVVSAAAANPGTTAAIAVGGMLAKNLAGNLLGKIPGFNATGLGVQKVMVTNFPAGLGGATPGGSGLSAKLAAGSAVLGAGIWAIDKWETAGEERNSANENAGISINKNQLELRRRRKEEKIKILEARGWSHGQAVYDAEHNSTSKIAPAAPADVRLNVTISDEVGTRHAGTVLRRGGTQ